MKSTATCIALTATFASGLAFAQPPKLASTPAWQHYAAESSCKLIRVRAARPELVFVTRPASETIELFVYFYDSKAKIGFGTGQLIVGEYRSDKLHFRTFKLTRSNGLVLRSSVTADEFARILHHGSIRVRAPRYGDRTIDLSGMVEAIAPIRICESSLARKWKIDGDWTRPPTIFDDARARFRPEDYPEDLIRRGVSGSAIVLLTVDAHGGVSACRPIEVSGGEVFGTITCSVLQSRARFEPGRDREGRPTASYIVTPRISFDIFD